MRKYGFVYLWYDKKHKRYYIGCRWGTENDGYICSSPWMKKGYKRRPRDFKRRILGRIYTNRKDLLEEEYRWLSKIKEEKLGKRYYNLHNHHFGHWTTDTNKNLSVREKIKQTLSDPEVREKIGAANRGRVKSEEEILKIKKARTKQVYTEETKKKMSASQSGMNNSFYGKTHSLETRQKMSESAKKRTSNRKHSEETKQRMSEIAKNRSKEHPSILNLRSLRKESYSHAQ